MCSKCVGFSKTMVLPVEVGCWIVASSLVPGKTSFQLSAPQFFWEFNCPALSHAAVSISCMAGESQVPDPFLGVHVREGNLTLLGTTQSDRCGWYYCPCLPSCPALRPLPGLLGSSRSLLSTSRLSSTLTSCCRGTWTSGLGTRTWGSSPRHSTWS